MSDELFGDDPFDWRREIASREVREVGGEAEPEPTGNGVVRASATGTTGQAAKCDEPAKPEVGPMRNAESPSGVQALGSSGLATRDRLRTALAAFRARKPEPTLTSYSAYAVNRLIEAIEDVLEP